MKAERIESKTRAENRVATLAAHIRAISREQGNLVSELVWNEMRAWEIQGRLAEPLGHEERSSLERECDRRLALITSMAKWEQSADNTVTKLRADLVLLLAEYPELGDEQLRALADERGLDRIARAAAGDLGLR